MHGVLTALLDEHETGFAIGVMGAIGEFMRDKDEACEATPLTRITPRGAIALQLERAQHRLIAWEEPSTDPRLWKQAAALILPEAEAAMGGHDFVTELGPDSQALRAPDRAGILFDMGVGFAHLRACVRTADPNLIDTLRAGCGMKLLDPANPAGMAIMHQSPHRVFLSKLGRIEVYQPIPSPDGRSPEGPHTHLLPKLLATGRAHAATSPIPEGWVSVLDIFPAHPLRTPMLEPRAFDAARHTAFQALLTQFGLPELLAARQAALATGAEGGEDRHTRAAARAGLRQRAAQANA